MNEERLNEEGNVKKRAVKLGRKIEKKEETNEPAGWIHFRCVSFLRAQCFVAELIFIWVDEVRKGARENKSNTSP